MMKSRRATSFAELMVALAIIALCIVPIFEFFRKMSEVPAISEDMVYAEVLATRVLERYGAKIYEDLEAMAGKEIKILDELFEDDRDDNWFMDLIEYRKSLGISKNYFKGTLKVEKLADGLVSLDVLVTWDPEDRGSTLENRYSYALMKFVSRNDLGIAYTKGEPEL